jgi:hypothetical protein
MGDFPLAPQCKTITAKFNSDPLATIFQTVPDKKSVNWADYQSKIAQPMDIATVRKRLKDNYYSGVQAWSHDMHLIFDNAIVYNGEYSVIGGVAVYLRKMLDKEIRALEATNLRNWESQLVTLTRKLERAIRKVPPAFNVELHFDTTTADSDDFTVDRIMRLRDRLEELVRQKRSSEILDVVRDTNSDAPFIDDLEIDLAHLGRRSLLALERLAEERG